MNIYDRAELTATLARHGLDLKLRTIDASWDDQNLTRCHIVDHADGKCYFTILPWTGSAPHRYAIMDAHNRAWLSDKSPADALEKALSDSEDRDDPRHFWRYA